jgi:hypothetical protein
MGAPGRPARSNVRRTATGIEVVHHPAHKQRNTEQANGIAVL